MLKHVRLCSFNRFLSKEVNITKDNLDFCLIQRYTKEKFLNGFREVINKKYIKVGSSNGSNN